MHSGSSFTLPERNKISQISKEYKMRIESYKEKSVGFQYVISNKVDYSGEKKMSVVFYLIDLR